MMKTRIKPSKSEHTKAKIQWITLADVAIFVAIIHTYIKVRCRTDLCALG